MANIQIKNIDNLSKEQLKQLVKQGGKFVIFQYTLSIVVMVFHQNSAIYFIKPGEGTAKYSWGYTLISCLVGWFGIKAIIYTIASVANNAGGGKDVTVEVANHLGLNSLDGYNIPGNSNTSSGSGNNNSSSGGYNIPGNSGSNNSGGYNIPR